MKLWRTTLTHEPLSLEKHHNKISYLQDFTKLEFETIELNGHIISTFS